MTFLKSKYINEKGKEEIGSITRGWERTGARGLGTSFVESCVVCAIATMEPTALET